MVHIDYYKYTAIVLFLSIILTVSGCSNSLNDTVYRDGYASETTALKVSEYDISLAEAIINLIINYNTFGITPDKVSTEGASVNEFALSNIREYNIIYKKAIEEDFSATPGDTELISTATDNFVKKYGELLKIYGISEENVYDVFYKQMIYTNYENSIKEEAGKKLYAGYYEALSDKQFVKLYQLSFPIVETDEIGNIITDSDGVPLKLSESDKSKVKDIAYRAQQDIKLGKDPEKCSEEYNVSIYSQYLNGFIGGFSDEINTAIEHLDNGECTDVLETDKAYIILSMIDNDDQDMKMGYAMNLVQENLDKKVESENQQILSTAEISDEDLVEWNSIDKELLSQKMFDLGLVIDQDEQTTQESF